MILLLLAALDRRRSLPGDQRALVPVPVWLTLGGWHPTTTALDEWVTATMNRDHPALRAHDYGPDAAGDLLRGGHVVLFLDGLDEMPEDFRTRALQRINDEAPGLRVLVTSRTSGYRKVLPAWSPADTAVIELRPVRADAAANYLTRNQTGPVRQQWERVGAYLKEHPNSIAAQAFDSPLYLSLARDSYASSDPTVLVSLERYPSVEAIRQHLIERILVTAYPGQRQRARATQWLTWISHHMGTSRDLQWWDVPNWIAPWQLRLARGLAAALMAGLAAGLALGLVLDPSTGLGAAIICGLGLGLGFGLARPRKTPTTFNARWPRPWELAIISVFSVASTLIVSFPKGPGSEGALKLGVGVFAAFTLCFAVWPYLFWNRPIEDLPSATPRSTYRADWRTGMIYGVTVGLAVGLTSGVTAGQTGFGYGLGFGLMFGLLIGLGLVLGTGQVPMVKLTEIILACQGLGKVRFLCFLEDACARQVPDLRKGLLRAS